MVAMCNFNKFKQIIYLMPIYISISKLLLIDIPNIPGLIKTLTGSSNMSAYGEKSMNKTMQLVNNLLNEMNVYRERLHLYLINLAETWGHAVIRAAVNGWDMRQDIISAVNNKVQSSVSIVHDIIEKLNERIESLASIVDSFISPLIQIQNHLKDIYKLIVQKAN